MKIKQLLLLVALLMTSFAYAQTDIPDAGTSGPLGGGSWLRFQTGGNPTSIVEAWGLNLMGSANQPVKVLNTSLLVGYSSGGGNLGQGNAFIQGNIGIGTITPQATLDVARLASSGDLTAVLSRLTEGNTVGSGTYLGIKAYDTQPSAATPNIRNVKSFSIEHSFYGNTNSSINFLRGMDGGGGSISFNTDNNSEKMRILYNGNVGIGTISPDARLAVKGTVHATEVLVDQTVPTPDYVFDKDYDLATLKDIKTYIDKNHHLPEIPSAAQVAKEGINLGEMNAKLLKKIEELTLYLIENENKDELQRIQINNMLLSYTKRIKHLQQQVNQLKANQNKAK